MGLGALTVGEVLQLSPMLSRSYTLSNSKQGVNHVTSQNPLNADKHVLNSNDESDTGRHNSNRSIYA